MTDWLGDIHCIQPYEKNDGQNLKSRHPSVNLEEVDPIISLLHGGDPHIKQAAMKLVI